MESGDIQSVIKFGPYVVEQKLGEGGMGRVFVARHEVLDRQVVIKTILPELLAHHPEVAARFILEAKAAALLDSPHVVRIFDAQTTADGTPYIVLELLRGQSLQRWIDQWQTRTGQPVPATYATIILAQAGLGIAHAHAAGIVHRDIKPDNLYLVEAPPDLAQRLAAVGGGLPRDLTVKVLDFGIAKLRTPDGNSATRTASTLGTPAYMAPEQLVDAKTADARSDVYALGAVAYQLVTGGHVPWGADTPVVRIYQRQLHEPPPDPTVLNPTLAPGVAAAIRKAMAFKREDRWPTVDAFVRSFAQAVAADAQLPAGPVLLAAYAPEIAQGPIPQRPGQLTVPMHAPHPRDTTLGSGVGSLGGTAPSPAARRRGLLAAVGLAAVVAAGVIGVVVFSGDSNPSPGPAGSSEPATSPPLDARVPDAAPPIDAAEVVAPPTDAAPVVDAVPAPDARKRTHHRDPGTGTGSSRGIRVIQ